MKDLDLLSLCQGNKILQKSCLTGFGLSGSPSYKQNRQTNACVLKPNFFCRSGSNPAADARVCCEELPHLS